MTLLEMGGAEDQGVLTGRSEGRAPGGTVAGASGVSAMGLGPVAVGFGLAAGGFGLAGEDFDGAADGFGGVSTGFDEVAEGFVPGFTDGAAGAAGADDVADAPGRGEEVRDDADCEVGDGEGTAEGSAAGCREGCAGIPIAGASACTPIRLPPMATARTAPTTETGHPSPRSRRPRRPDWSTKTGPGAGSSKLDPDISGCTGYADPRSGEPLTERTLRGLSLQGT
ncbi:hypothetical protein [Streptomyces sp. NBC_01264]|uniref:hypothetical protein n=1 Tax=Streptomyces sp. NBC_01264 TaxID=2903804 RepID=UPI00224E5658|nr:hypothetical protein [Streptomyces sp. NBC_01264]MCX4776637.1 hypothetical protein [Streptomyces sp. NBC_01264]